MRPAIPATLALLCVLASAGCATRASEPGLLEDAALAAYAAKSFDKQAMMGQTVELGRNHGMPVVAWFPCSDVCPQYTVRIDWTCDPAQTTTLVQQVFKEIAFVRDTTLSPDQVNRIRAALQREFEQQSQNNGYLLGQISRRYQDKDAANVASVFDMRQRIAALTGAQIQEAAQTYLNMRDYVKVTLMPERR